MVSLFNSFFIILLWSISFLITSKAIEGETFPHVKKGNGCLQKHITIFDSQGRKTINQDRYDNLEELFDSYFSSILQHVNTDEYIIGLYGDVTKYIIAFTNKLNIIKYYNNYDIKMGLYSKLVETGTPQWDKYCPFSKNTTVPVIGIQKDKNDLLLNDLQIDMIHTV